MRLKNDRLAYEILSAVSEIPFGKVATYGQIARLIGRDKNARLVGSVLRHAADYGDYPSATAWSMPQGGWCRVGRRRQICCVMKGWN